MCPHPQVKLYNEKRSDLEEQQLHLNIGLQKIRETVDQVEELQASLSIKKNELEQKNALANQKLKEMVKDQQEAEKRKVTSQEIQEQLRVQTQSIKSKREVVLGDLAKVEPAVKEAQNGQLICPLCWYMHVHEVTTGHWLFCVYVEQIVSHTTMKSLRKIALYTVLLYLL